MRSRRGRADDVCTDDEKVHEIYEAWVQEVLEYVVWDEYTDDLWILSS